uniref:Uncharacterized protein n=1 Tax=Anguilla anguilla TaxID=7936 RepID=A0A0E9WU55_ANGAN
MICHCCLGSECAGWLQVLHLVKQVSFILHSSDLSPFLRTGLKIKTLPAFSSRLRGSSQN